jgi:hypothetical protein
MDVLKPVDSSCVKKHNPDNILTVDIGGTRFKYALLPSKPTLADLQNSSIHVTSSKIDEKLPLILDVQNPDGIVSRFKQRDFQRVSVSLPGPVAENNTQFLYHVPTVPRDMKHQFQQAVHKPVVIENDSVNWLRGVIRLTEIIETEKEYPKLVDRQIQYPCLLVAFGTGIAVSIANSEKDCKEFHLSSERVKYTQFESAIKRDVPKSTWIHGLVTAHFDRIEEKDKDAQIIARNAINAFLQDLIQHLNESGQKINTLYVTGGHARHLTTNDVNSEKLGQIAILNEENLKVYKFAPELVSLLGCIVTNDLFL